MGSLYALIALGYTMVYGVLRLINFAHSEVFMMGAFAGLFAAKLLGYDPMAGAASFGLLQALLVLVFAMGAAALLGMTIERLAYRPVRHAPKLTALITAIGVSLLLQSIGLLAFGAAPRPFPAIVPDPKYSFGGVEVSGYQILIFAVTAALMLGLQALVQYTWTGKAMRAVSQNMNAARLMGISVNRVIALTFALGSSLAAAAGILFGLYQIKIDPQVGVMVGLKAFVAAVLGGIGNIRGAVLGGIVIGVAEQMTAGYISTNYRDAVTFLILIGVLLLKPEGILGVVRQEKV